MIKSSKSYLGDIMLLFVALIWGFGFVAVKIGLNNGMDPFFLLFLRFSVAGLALIPFQIKNIRSLSLSTWKRGGILGIFIFLGFAFQTIGLNYTTTSKNAFLTGINVIIVPFLTWLFTKKKVDTYSIIASFLCMIGIGFLTLNDSLTINIGDFFTIICAFMFAVHIALTSIIAKEESALTMVFIQMIIGAILSLLFSLIFKESLLVNSSSFMAILYLGIFSTLIGFLLQLLGQRYSQASKAAILLSTESLFGAILAILIFKDSFGIQMILGGILIFSSIFISETKLSFLKRKTDYERQQENLQ